MLFDLQNDPHQEHVLEDAEQSDRLLTAMTAAFEENDAPEEMYSRYGLKAVPGEGGINDCTPAILPVLACWPAGVRGRVCLHSVA